MTAFCQGTEKDWLCKSPRAVIGFFGREIPRVGQELEVRGGYELQGLTKCRAKKN